MMVVQSSKVRKQRKFVYDAPLHVRRNMLASHLSEDLAKRYNRRSFPIRTGDEVEVMRGDFKGKKGKISKVDLKFYRVYVEGMTLKKVEGTERMAALHPSNLRILSLNLEDKRRAGQLERVGVTNDKEA